MTTATYGVQGMTCRHCITAVTTELATLSGVTAVHIDLVPSGISAVTVTSDAPLAEQAIAEVLDEAGGYTLAEARARTATPTHTGTA